MIEKIQGNRPPVGAAAFLKRPSIVVRGSGFLSEIVRLKKNGAWIHRLLRSDSARYRACVTPPSRAVPPSERASARLVWIERAPSESGGTSGNIRSQYRIAPL